MAGLELALEIVVLDDGMLVKVRMGRHQGHWNFGGQRLVGRPSGQSARVYRVIRVNPRVTAVYVRKVAYCD
ncbi:hypothetical protein CS8_060640 [Cupriavidus sp. 8B]